MKVKCTNDGHPTAFTVGKIYDVIRCIDDGNGLPPYYSLLNDQGDKVSAYQWRFEQVKEEPSWDASTRGPQMANPQARTIFKYSVPTLEQFELSMPEGAELIRIAHIDGFTWAWAVVDLRKPLASRKFRAFKTGATIPDDFDTSAYVGFYPIYVQMELGLYVFEEK